jgi:hypothetical protein
MKKFLLLFLALLAMNANVYSQRVMLFYRGGDMVKGLPVSDIDSVKFATVETFTVASGTTGNCTWNLIGIVGITGKYTLTISGNGAMGSYTHYVPAPWSEYRDNITTLILQKGITNIGSYAFANCSSLTNAIIPSSVTTIGDRAFEHCNGLTDIANLHPMPQTKQPVLPYHSDREEEQFTHHHYFKGNREPIRKQINNNQ